MSNQQTKDGFYRQNGIHFNNVPQRNQTKYPTRKARTGYHRQQTNHATRRQFELNRNKASGMRQPIQFNDMSNNTRFSGRKHGRVLNLATTMNPSTVRPSTNWATPDAIITSTSTSTIEFVTHVSSNVISNDVTHYTDHNYQQRNEEIERLRLEERMRRKKADHLWHMEQERIKEKRQHDLAVRRQEGTTEHQPVTHVNEPIQKEQTQRDDLREQNERNKHTQSPDMQTNQRRQQQQQQQPIKQTNDEQNTVQTNEIFGETVSTTARSLETKKLRNRKFRERIKKLSPEEQQLFFQKRAERNRKRAN